VLRHEVSNGSIADIDQHGMIYRSIPTQVSRQPLVTEQDSVPIPGHGSLVPTAIAGSYPPRSGNKVQPWVDGVPAFRRIAAAIEGARHSIWLTVAFYAPDFQFPDGYGDLFHVLDRSARRGLDVRVLFWRPNAESNGYGRTFAGTSTEQDLLQRSDFCFNIRWDRAATVYCQHQKSWLIDAGMPTETSFVGGVNLTAKALGSPGHEEGGQHDLYLELAGPSATDVHHNFVQRWNEASERNRPDGIWGVGGNDTLPFPLRISPPKGESNAQVQRMVHPGRYANGHPTPGGSSYGIESGEKSILDQYERAIDAARSSIYIENQALPIPAISRRLEAALQRGVEVIFLAPADEEVALLNGCPDAPRRRNVSTISPLTRYENFSLIGLAVPGGGQRRAVYVHAKAMLVDDAWMTVGSCNLHSNSLGGHTEMNVSV
jgi:cardiolipin synthase